MGITHTISHINENGVIQSNEEHQQTPLAGVWIETSKQSVSNKIRLIAPSWTYLGFAGSAEDT